MPSKSPAAIRSLMAMAAARLAGPNRLCPQLFAAGAVGLLVGHGLLRDAGQGVVLAHDADDRPTFTVAGHEGGGHLCHPALDLEALGLGVVGEQRGRARLAQRGFGEGPDLVGQLGHLGSLAVDAGDGLLLCRARVGRLHRRRRDEADEK